MTSDAVHRRATKAVRPCRVRARGGGRAHLDAGCRARVEERGDQHGRSTDGLGLRERLAHEHEEARAGRARAEHGTGERGGGQGHAHGLHAQRVLHPVDGRARQDAGERQHLGPAETPQLHGLLREREDLAGRGRRRGGRALVEECAEDRRDARAGAIEVGETRALVRRELAIHARRIAPEEQRAAARVGNQHGGLGVAPGAGDGWNPSTAGTFE